jgi:phage baseplate assembly protein W
MSQARFTALRFNALRLGLRDLTGSGGFGVTPTGKLETVADEPALRQSLILLLSTVPGERVMRPDYGCPLNKFAFAPNDATTAGLVIHEVRRSIERNEPRVDIVAVDAGPDPDDETRLVIDVTYRVRVTAAVNTVSLPLDLQA